MALNYEVKKKVFGFDQTKQEKRPTDGQCSVSAAALWQKRMTEHPRSIHPMCIP